MQFNPSVFDIWVFRRTSGGAEYLVLHASQAKADRHFNGGRFWQIPSGVIQPDETVLAAIDRKLESHSLHTQAVWAAEHTYTIYNRRFDEIQVISVFAAEVGADAAAVTLDADEHAAFEWLTYERALERVHYRGLKDGLRSTHEYIAGVARPARELQLR